MVYLIPGKLSNKLMNGNLKITMSDGVQSKKDTAIAFEDDREDPIHNEVRDQVQQYKKTYNKVQQPRAQVQQQQNYEEDNNYGFG